MGVTAELGIGVALVSCAPSDPLSPVCPQAAPAVPQAVRALVLVPSAELARQVGHTLRRLTAFCGRQLRVAELCGQAELAEQRSVTPDTPWDP